jgi:hypothetical protein
MTAHFLPFSLGKFARSPVSATTSCILRPIQEEARLLPFIGL